MLLLGLLLPHPLCAVLRTSLLHGFFYFLSVALKLVSFSPKRLDYAA